MLLVTNPKFGNGFKIPAHIQLTHLTDNSPHINRYTIVQKIDMMNKQDLSSKSFLLAKLSLVSDLLLATNQRKTDTIKGRTHKEKFCLYIMLLLLSDFS
jgi:hypothetical protein